MDILHCSKKKKYHDADKRILSITKQLKGLHSISPLQDLRKFLCSIRYNLQIKLKNLFLKRV